MALKKHEEYNALSKYARSCLVATNFWRIASGRQPIPVPKEDKKYHEQFTESHQKKAQDIFNEKIRTK